MASNTAVRFAVTSHDKPGDQELKSGFYREELTTPCWMIKDTGYDIDSVMQDLANSLKLDTR